MLDTLVMLAKAGAGVLGVSFLVGFGLYAGLRYGFTKWPIEIRYIKVVKAKKPEAGK
ncbi:MAG: hypothetical protein K9K66_04300 [Desulfarculaceae bacterium]|nr:hypothetical protein [Desulfarculaceae bacterium]MCF8073264.1 hypothetical protein [Desulfarculaceae bacterium]MCF8100860.1 hypothetical protein [Desulfarculaceae bacterium]